ncbi:MAG: hypothetical protein K0S46_2490 [Moraxellaceae bacterium]|jgi:uncharacterized membrane protein|nr:hypothetical protein [Moraxellaceae bacterium]
MNASVTEKTAATRPAIRRVSALRPFHWLREGWRDFLRHPGPSMIYGVIVTLGGWGALSLALPHAEFFSTAVAGFVMVTPLIAAGVYELSRQCETGDCTGFLDSVKALRRNAASIADYGLALLLIGLLWERVVAVMFALSYGGDMGSVTDFASNVLFSGDYVGVVTAWLLSGALMASVVFAATAVGMPMVIDRDCDVVTAMLTSVRAVLTNLPAMTVWAGLIVGLSLLAMSTLLVGLVVVMPLLGHAAWCAYRDVVE